MSTRVSAALAACILLFVLAYFAAQSADLSNAFLPGHIEAQDGQVSLFADYQSIRSDGRVPVYLVNKSSEALVLNTQDGDIYLKLQYLASAEKWVRAQPHGFSWCGNSYMTTTVLPGHYALVNGYQPINGVSRTVRYHLYLQDIEISSNAGDGVVADADIERASSDALSIQEGSFQYVSQVALSEVPVVNQMDHISDLRQTAIRALASDRFAPDKSRKVLRQVREKSPDMIDAADRAIQMLDQRLAEAAGEPG